MPTTPSCFYYPTTVLIVSHNQPLISKLKLGLAPNQCYQAYHNPIAALDLIHQDKLFSAHDIPHLSRQQLANHKTAHDRGQIQQIANLHLDVYNRHRFEEVSVILVDYVMPNMSGLDFCQFVQDIPVKTLLLIDSNEIERAIEAKEFGIIDDYIVKNSNGFFDQLNQMIYQLKQAYFSDASKPLIHQLSQTHDTIYHYPAYARFFADFYQDHHCCEFYLIDNSGSCLLLDEFATPTWLIIKNKTELEAYVELAKIQQDCKSVIDDIATHRKIPFLFDPEHANQHIRDWQPYLFSAQPLPGCPQHYYAVTGQLHHYRIVTEAILSLSEYLDASVLAPEV